MATADLSKRARLYMALGKLSVDCADGGPPGFAGEERRRPRAPGKGQSRQAHLLTYGSGGPGTQMHLVSELLKQQAGMETVHVPYRGTAPVLQDLLAGRIDYYFDPATGFSHIREGRVRLLAVTGTRRSPFVPDAPTLAEAGIKGVELGNWFGLFAPAATPPEVVARLSLEVAKAVALPEVKQRFAELGVAPVAQDSGTFRKTVADKTRVLSALIKERRIAID